MEAALQLHSSEVKTALQLHFLLWMWSCPVYMKMELLKRCVVLIVHILTKKSKYIVLLSYSQLSQKSADFSISVSKLLLNLDNPRLHLYLQTQTSVQNLSIPTVSDKLSSSCCIAANCMLLDVTVIMVSRVYELCALT